MRHSLAKIEACLDNQELTEVTTGAIINLLSEDEDESVDEEIRRSDNLK